MSSPTHWSLCTFKQVSFENMHNFVVILARLQHLVGQLLLLIQIHYLFLLFDFIITFVRSFPLFISQLSHPLLYFSMFVLSCPSFPEFLLVFQVLLLKHSRLFQSAQIQIILEHKFIIDGIFEFINIHTILKMLSLHKKDGGCRTSHHYRSLTSTVTPDDLFKTNYFIFTKQKQPNSLC